jgi:hypothetical protein
MPVSERIYAPSTFIDNDYNGIIIPGRWREEVPSGQNATLQPVQQLSRRIGTRNAPTNALHIENISGIMIMLTVKMEVMKNASTHNIVIYYPISMNKKIKDMVFQALQNSHKMFFFGVIFNS